MQRYYGYTRMKVRGRTGRVAPRSPRGQCRDKVLLGQKAHSRGKSQSWQCKKRVKRRFLFICGLIARNRFFCELFFSQRKAEELEMPKIFGANYGSARTYPAEAWQEIYGVDLKELF